MMTPFTFHGSHNRSVDAKGRFNLPLQFRVAGEDKYMVSWGVSGVLTLSPYSVWVSNFNRMRALEATDELRDFLREISRTSRVVEPDLQGRVAVTAELLSPVGIDRKISIIGMGNYMELWDPKTLDQLDSGIEKLSPKLMNEFFR